MRLRLRRTALAAVVLLGIAVFMSITADMWYVPTNDALPSVSNLTPPSDDETVASTVLEQLPVKGRAPKTGYARAQFGNGWAAERGCDMRNIILARDLIDSITNQRCQVTSGLLHDPYTGKSIQFVRGPESSQLVQIDHVVALSNAWQTGAQQLSGLSRMSLANDPLNLLAVEGLVNQEKSAADAATWLPPNKSFRCQYVARQIAVKRKYELWVVPAEKVAMQQVLSTCSSQRIPKNSLEKVMVK